jgi:hypothetical protein
MRGEPCLGACHDNTQLDLPPLARKPAVEQAARLFINSFELLINHSPAIGSEFADRRLRQ